MGNLIVKKVNAMFRGKILLAGKILPSETIENSKNFPVLNRCGLKINYSNNERTLINSIKPTALRFYNKEI